jgi:hypothetical protein
VEKIKLSQVEEEYYKYDDTNKGLTQTPSQKTAKESTIVLPSINEEIASLNPPQTVKDVMKGLISDTESIPSPTNEIVVPINNPPPK